MPLLVTKQCSKLYFVKIERKILMCFVLIRYTLEMGVLEILKHIYPKSVCKVII